MEHWTEINSILCENFSCEGGKLFTAAEFLGGILAIFSLILLYWRTVNSDKELKLHIVKFDRQISKEIDDRFDTAMLRLGNGQTSVRTEAVYSLCELAKKEEKYRVQIAQILCSHIRSKTQEEKYKADHTNQPSNEIQTTIDLLFKTTNEVKGIYRQFPELPKADLRRSCLVGADFSNADCTRVNFSDSNCMGANFTQANCADTDFRGADCTGAEFSRATCLGANFRGAECIGAFFYGAKCLRSIFEKADCSGSNFSSAKCIDANFTGANCTGSNFSSALFVGVDFLETNCTSCNFGNTDCTGAKFSATDCTGAYSQSITLNLKQRINKSTELDFLIVSGNNLEIAIQLVKKFMPTEELLRKMQHIIEKHKGQELQYGIPEGIISGVLQNSDELQAIINKLELVEKKDWQALREMKKEESKKE